MATIIKLTSVKAVGNATYINIEGIERFYLDPDKTEATIIRHIGSDFISYVKETPGQIWKLILEAERTRKLFLDHGPDADAY